MFLQDVTRYDLPRELIQFVERRLHVVYKDDSIFESDYRIRGHLRTKEFSTQQRRQSSRLNRVPHIPSKHRDRSASIDPSPSILLVLVLVTGRDIEKVRDLGFDACRGLCGSGHPNTVQGLG